MITIRKFGQVFLAFGQVKLWGTCQNGQVGKKVNVKPCLIWMFFLTQLWTGSDNPCWF